MERYRSVLEVMKWASLKDVLLSLSYVCVHWEKTSSSEELCMLFSEACELYTPPAGLSHKERLRYCRIPLSLALFQSSRLCLYNPLLDTWKAVSLSRRISVDKGSCWAAVDHGFLCCGGFGLSFLCGGSEFKCAFKVTHSGEVTLLPDMIVPRKMHGMVACGKFCYVFGGMTFSNQRDFVTDQCEKIDLQTLQQWVTFPPMLSARYMFNPCVHGESIYLFGGYTRQCEVFSPVTEVYTLLKMSVGALPSAAVSCGGRVVVFAGEVALEWDGSEVVGERQFFALGNPWSNCNPVGRSENCWMVRRLQPPMVLKIQLDELLVGVYTFS